MSFLSRQKFITAVPEKDPVTGLIQTQVKQVEGPISYLETTALEDRSERALTAYLQRGRPDLLTGDRGEAALFLGTRGGGRLRPEPVCQRLRILGPAGRLGGHAGAPPDAPERPGPGRRVLAAAAALRLRGSTQFASNLMLEVKNVLHLEEDIRSLSEFKRNSHELMQQLRESGRPMVLTVNGKAQVVVQDASSYQKLLDRVEAIEAIREGLADVDEDRTRPARQALPAIQKRRSTRA